MKRDRPRRTSLTDDLISKQEETVKNQDAASRNQKHETREQEKEGLTERSRKTPFIHDKTRGEATKVFGKRGSPSFSRKGSTLGTLMEEEEPKPKKTTPTPGGRTGGG